MANPLDDCIHRPHGNTGADHKLEAMPAEQTGYAEGNDGHGNNIIVDVNAPNCLAKIVMDPATRTLKPFIKVGSFGAMNDWPYDPYDPNMRIGDGGRHGMKDGRKLYDFKKVSEATFGHYLTFLRTGDKKWLHHARRSRT